MDRFYMEQGDRESNSGLQFWRLSCYLYTITLRPKGQTLLLGVIIEDVDDISHTGIDSTG